MPVDNIENSGPLEAVPQEHIVFTDLDGVEGVLVDLDTKKYYQLNETAALVWRGLEKRRTVEQISGEMATLYDVPLGQAASSVEKLIKNFYAHRLVRSG